MEATKQTGQKKRRRRRSKKVQQLSAALPSNTKAKKPEIENEDNAEEQEKEITITKNKAKQVNDEEKKEKEKEGEEEEEEKEKEEQQGEDNEADGKSDEEEQEDQERPTKKMKIPDELKDKITFKNKQRVLVFCTKGITHKERLLMLDLRRMLPHSKKEGKFDSKDKLGTISEICGMKGCNNCIFFESRKRKDLYLWLCKTPNGPGCRFLVTSIVPMSEHRLTGNCLKGSRPLLSFSKHFDEQPHYQLVKELLLQVFNVPKACKGSKPFIDHVIMFSIQDGRVWFRHYQILENDKGTQDLVEIGPRFVMQLIRIFDGSFGGQTLYKNPEFVNPNKVRASTAKQRSGKYLNRVRQKKEKKERDGVLLQDRPRDTRDDVFNP